MPSLKNVSRSVASPSTDEVERQLVRRCVAGDAAAWRQLYEQHFAKVERLTSALGIADAEADDLCQDIFLIIYRHLGRFRGEAQLATWIHRLATREAIRYAKKSRLRRALTSLFARDQRDSHRPTWSDTAAGRTCYLQDLLGSLSPERRLAIVLYEIEGVPVSEIARLSNCAEGTIWTRLHRARRDLEKLSEEKGR